MHRSTRLQLVVLPRLGAILAHHRSTVIKTAAAAALPSQAQLMPLILNSRCLHSHTISQASDSNNPLPSTTHPSLPPSSADTTAAATAATKVKSNPASTNPPNPPKVKQPKKWRIPQEGDIVEDKEFVFFWQPPAWPGQWTEVSFIVKGVKYTSAEQYMMAQKAHMFGDMEIYQKILDSTSPREQKTLGRMVKDFNPKKWDEQCLDIVVKGNFAKFSQNLHWGKRLLATRSKTLVEASPYDPIWGVGMDVSHPDIRTPSKWLGKNLLGQALMIVRAKLMIIREAKRKQGKEARAANEAAKQAAIDAAAAVATGVVDVPVAADAASAAAPVAADSASDAPQVRDQP